MSAAQIIDATPAQASAIEARNAFLRVSHFLDVDTDDDHMVFAPPIGGTSLVNIPKVIVRDFEDVTTSMRAHMEEAFKGGPDARYHDLQREEELKALGKRAQRQRERPQVAPLYLIDA